MINEPREITLSFGGSDNRYDAEGNMTVCAMEYAAYIAGEEHSDSPKCVSPQLITLSINLNDSVGPIARQHLRPYIVRMIGTTGDGQENARAMRIADWGVREAMPHYLSGLGLYEYAGMLEDLPALTHRYQVGEVIDVLDYIREKSQPGDHIARKGGVSELTEFRSCIRKIEFDRGGYYGRGLTSIFPAMTDGDSDSATKATLRNLNTKVLETLDDVTALHLAKIYLAEPHPQVAHEVGLMEEQLGRRAGEEDSWINLLNDIIDPGGLHDISELPETEELKRELAYLGF